jgi:hypothetical protein
MRARAPNSDSDLGFWALLALTIRPALPIGLSSDARRLRVRSVCRDGTIRDRARRPQSRRLVRESLGRKVARAARLARCCPKRYHLPDIALSRQT